MVSDTALGDQAGKENLPATAATVWVERESVGAPEDKVGSPEWAPLDLVDKLVHSKGCWPLSDIPRLSPDDF